MFIPLLLFTSSAILLYLSSHSLIKNITLSFYRLTKSHHTSINLLFFLLLPGIFLHEFSHIIIAELLRVPTGELKLKPQLKDNQIKLGSAQIASTDPLRLTLIGTAPFIIGTFTLWALLKLGLNINLSQLTIFNFFPQIIYTINQTPILIIILLFYLLFAISNTMFSSSSDLQSAAFPVILILILLGLAKLTNFNLPQTLTLSISSLLLLLTTIFILTLILNLILLFPLKLIKPKH